MTYKEAKQLIEVVRDHGGYTDSINEAFNKALEAIEKQIPMKPDEFYDGYADGYPVIEYTCPCCGREVDDTEYYCLCGQLLDWSYEE